jgi:hypothetical protein
MSATPRQNRVLPTGEVIACRARGAWMGNRGCLHDTAGKLVRRWTTRNWLICRLEFRGRRRTVMAPGRYTELFFLDEATALAAGHRPCFECRREDFQRFTAAWASGHGTARPDAGEMDRSLHRERRLSGAPRAAPLCFAADLPDGAIVEWPGRAGAWLLRSGAIWRWNPAGYHAPEAEARQAVLPITPTSTLAAIRAGYQPQIDLSAQR